MIASTVSLLRKGWRTWLFFPFPVAGENQLLPTNNGDSGITLRSSFLPVPGRISDSRLIGKSVGLLGNGGIICLHSPLLAVNPPPLSSRCCRSLPSSPLYGRRYVSIIENHRIPPIARSLPFLSDEERRPLFPSRRRTLLSPPFCLILFPSFR